MQYSKLGNSGLDVSRVCLGTMTWGTQNSQQDAEQQIEYALEQGVNFIDTAEMYSIPPNAESYGKTESMIGNWQAINTSRREDYILATKMAGNGLPYIREGSDISGKTLIQAVDASLKRLRTDYIDLYQLHWPNRTSPHFAKHWPGTLSYRQVDKEAESAQMLDILQTLSQCIKEGKIRHWGLSNDTPWGINQYLQLSDKHDLPKPVSIQDEFNLLHSKDWPYLIENCVMDDVAYLPWSPLASGALTGKYIDGARPEGSRWTFMQRNGLFRDTEYSQAAIKDYLKVAEKYQVSLAQLALAWVNQVEGVSSTIIGATSLDQLKENIQAFEMKLSDEVMEDINAVMHRYPMPY